MANDIYFGSKRPPAAQNGEEEIPAEKNKLGLGMVALACLICAVGAALLLS